MQYKVYIVENSHFIGESSKIIGNEFNEGQIYNSIEDAEEDILSFGDFDTNYTILPHIKK